MYSSVIVLFLLLIEIVVMVAWFVVFFLGGAVVSKYLYCVSLFQFFTLLHTCKILCNVCVRVWGGGRAGALNDESIYTHTYTHTHSLSLSFLPPLYLLSLIHI